MNAKKTIKTRSDSIFTELPGIKTESEGRMQKVMGGMSIGRQMFQTGLHALTNGHLTQASEDFNVALADFKASNDSTLYTETSDMLGGIAAEEAANGNSHPTLQAVNNSLAATDFLSASTIENGIHSGTIHNLANDQYDIARSEWLTLAQNQQTGEHYTKAAQSYQQLQLLDSTFGHQNKAASDGDLSQAEQYMSLAFHSGNALTMAQDSDQAASYFAQGGDRVGTQAALTTGALSWETASLSASTHTSIAQYLDHAANDWYQLGNTQSQETDQVIAAVQWSMAGQDALGLTHFCRAFNDFNNAYLDYKATGHADKAQIELGNMDTVKGVEAYTGGHFNLSAENYELAAQAYMAGNASAIQIATAYETEGYSWEQAGHYDKAGHSFMKGGSLERNAGQLDAAIGDFQTAAGDFAQGNDSANEAWAYTDLGNAEFQQYPGRGNGAVAHWERAEQLYETLSQQAGNNSQAINYLQEARKVGENGLEKLSSINAVSAGLEGQQAHTDSLIAAIYENESDWSDAANYRMNAGNDYMTAAQMAKNSDNREEMKDFYTKAAVQYGFNHTASKTNAYDDFWKAGDYNEALQALQDAITAHNDANNS